MKSLDSLLDSLRLKSAVQNRVVVGEPWGVLFPPQPRTAKFHFVEEGGGLLVLPGDPPLPLHEGDLALVFSNGGHVVQDRQSTPPAPLADLLRDAAVICHTGLTLQFGGDGPLTSIISGDFRLDGAGTHPLWRVLPPVILLRGREGQPPEWLDRTLALLSSEAMEVRPGFASVLDRLCDVLFIQALRGWLRTGKEGGWPAAVRDPAIDEALDLMQRLPEEPWTVESLATRVALSRSVFADRFRRLTGETPMEYLTQWRMHRASLLLLEGAASVASVAERVGYESEASFAKAFKRRVGTAPGAYRRKSRGAHP